VVAGRLRGSTYQVTECSHSDDFDYKNYLEVEMNKIKHQIIEGQKIAKTDTSEIEILEGLGWKIFNQYKEEQTGAASNHREEDEGDTTDNAATTFDEEEQTGAMSNYREEDEEHSAR